MKRALFLTAAVSLFACSPAPAQQRAEATPLPASATESITAKELDDRWQALDPAGHAEAAQKLYDGRRAALDAIIADTLIARGGQGEEHDRRGLRSGRDLQARMKPVSDVGRRHVLSVEHQSDAGPLARSDGAGDQPLPAPISSATRRAQALIAELAQGRPRVRVLFDAPRHDDRGDRRRSVDRTAHPRR